MKPSITSVTLSITLSDKEFGKGEECFMSVKGEYPEAGIPLTEIDQVMNDGLDMYFGVWKTILANRFVNKVINAVTLKDNLDSAEKRLHNVKKFLNKPVEEINEQPEPEPAT
jgi:hypothetical protein